MEVKKAVSVFEKASCEGETTTLAMSFVVGASEVERLGSWKWRVVAERVMPSERVTASSWS